MLKIETCDDLRDTLAIRPTLILCVCLFSFEYMTEIYPLASLSSRQLIPILSSLSAEEAQSSVRDNLLRIQRYI